METLGKLEGWDDGKQAMAGFGYVFGIFFFHILAVTIFVVFGASDSVINIVGNITFLVGPTIMVIAAFKLAKWRIELMAKNKKDGAEGAKKAEGEKDAAKDGEGGASAEGQPSLAKQLAISVCLPPCAGGQEAAFVEKYEATFENTAW